MSESTQPLDAGLVRIRAMQDRIDDLTEEVEGLRDAAKEWSGVERENAALRRMIAEMRQRLTVLLGEVVLP